MKYRDHFDRELFCRKMLSAKAPRGSTDVLVTDSDSNRIISQVDVGTKIMNSNTNTNIQNNKELIDNDIDVIDNTDNNNNNNNNNNISDDDSNNVNVGDSRFVLSILRTHNSDEDSKFKYEANIKGYSEYPYCLVMFAADRSLADIMTHEHVAGKDWKQIRLIMEQIIENLDQMHSRGFIHGDMKPQNIVRDGSRMKLIDLESSVCYVEGAYAGVKVSSGYAPPEMVQLASQLISSSVSSSSSLSSSSLSSSSLSSSSLIISNELPLLITNNVEMLDHNNNHINKVEKKKAFVKALHRSNVPKKNSEHSTISLPINNEKTDKYYNSESSSSSTTNSNFNINIDINSDNDFHDQVYNYPLLLASPSYDMWSAGVIFFELCAGEPLFLSDEADNIDTESLILLESWNNDLKRKKLLKVSDPYARHLLSQLLQKNPSRRPLTKRVLAHPFLTGKKAQRLVGEKAEYDVFISYRVLSDSHHAERLYNLLTKKGLKVWWDQISLQPGVPWEEGFCDGLLKSKSFIPLLSREGIKGFSDLNEHSRCDNVLLEYRMAQELRSAGFIERIFPVMIGDKENIMIDNNNYYLYNDYLQNGCHPINIPGCSVLSIENKLRSHFDNTALGAPFFSERSVSSILSDIMSNQGGFVKGKLLSSLLNDKNDVNNNNNNNKINIDELQSDIKEENKNNNEDKNEVDAFSTVVDSIIKMLGMDNKKNKLQNDDIISLDGVNDGDFEIFDILSPGIFRRNGNKDGGFGRIKVPKKDQKDAIEKQIAYLNSMLADLNDDDYYDID